MDKFQSYENDDCIFLGEKQCTKIINKYNTQDDQ